MAGYEPHANPKLEGTLKLFLVVGFVGSVGKNIFDSILPLSGLPRLLVLLIHLLVTAVLLELGVRVVAKLWPELTARFWPQQPTVRRARKS